MRLRTLAAFFPLAANSVLAAAGFDNSAGFDNLINQGRAAFLAADTARAESVYSQACPADLVNTYPVAKAIACENLLASVDEVRGNLVRAEQRYVHAAAVAEQAGPAYQPVYCARLIDLGEHYHRSGRAADAQAILVKAAGLARTLSGVWPKLLPEALIRLGGMYSDSSEPERGRAPLTEALSIVKTLSAANDGGDAGLPAIAAFEVAYARNALGKIDLAAGNEREAESSLREALTLATSELGENHPVTARYQASLALALLMDRQFDRAGLLFRRAQFVLESRPEPSERELGVVYSGMSAVANNEGKMALAEDYARRAISVLSGGERPDIGALSLARLTLAGVYLRTHNTAEAEKILPVVVDALRAKGANPNSLAAAMELLGDLRAQQRNWKAAESLYREAIGIYERGRDGAARPAIAPLLLALADVLKKDGGSKAEVRALEARARDISRSA